MYVPFKECVRRMPALVAEAFDPLAHLRQKDLADLAQHILDLNCEGELSLLPRERISLKRFIHLCGEEVRHGSTPTR